MKTISFSSDLFKPYLPEECQVNPNLFGFELANWLSQQLAHKGIVTSYPNEEDFAWYLSWSDDAKRALLIFCGGSLEESQYQWQIFLKESRGWFSKQKISNQEIEGFYQIIITILKENAITATVEDE